MSDATKITERQLTVGLVKLSLMLTFLVVLFGFVGSLIAHRYESIATNSLLFCFAFFMLSNGLLAILHIVDWFEARRAKRNA